MKEYPKIQSIYKRDETTKRFLIGQYSMEEFEFLAELPWIWTEKVDGTNIRVMWDGTEVRFGGKTDNAQIYVPLLNELRQMFPVDKFANLYPGQPMCLYGEGYGARVQKGGGNYIADGVSFVLFDVLVDSWWLRREDVADVASKLAIEMVPIVGDFNLKMAVEVIQGKTLQSRWGSFLAEGVVGRPAVDLFNRKGQRIITKIKHRDFE